jgi:hypothetical protein
LSNPDFPEASEEALYSNSVAEEWNRESELKHVNAMLAAPSMMSLRSLMPMPQQQAKPSDAAAAQQVSILLITISAA